MPPSEHDAFHRPTSDDPWWQETAWFTLMVPERNLYCYVYPWVKANQGILGGGVMVWDDRGRHPWDALHWDYQWTYPYPELGDLRDITFPTGIRMRCLEPLHEVPRHLRAPALLVRRHLRRDPARARPRRGRRHLGDVLRTPRSAGSRHRQHHDRRRAPRRRLLRDARPVLGPARPDPGAPHRVRPLRRGSAPRSWCSRNPTRRGHRSSRTSATSGATATRCRLQSGQPRARTRRRVAEPGDHPGRATPRARRSKPWATS